MNARRGWFHRPAPLTCAILLAGAAAAGPVFAPQLLAFPHKRESNGFTVRSEMPLDEAALDRVTARAGQLVAASPIAQRPERRKVFLTNGGWRWYWLSLTTSDSLAFTRPLSEAVIVNRSNLGADRMELFKPPAHKRRLSGIIAHETCHGMVRRRIGLVRAILAPAWKVEGYCDHVAQESSLSDAAYRQLIRSGGAHRGKVYYEGRRRVEAELARNGGDVAALFRG